MSLFIYKQKNELKTEIEHNLKRLSEHECILKHRVRELNNSIARERREIGRRIESIKYLKKNLEKLESAAKALNTAVPENVDPISSPAKTQNMEGGHNDTSQNYYEEISDASDSEQSEDIEEDEKTSASTTYININNTKPFIYLGITKNFRY